MSEISVRTVTVELLRSGPPHNQLLSPLTPYLGVCGDTGAGIVTLPFEHAAFLRRLKLLRYDGGETPGRMALLREVGISVARILGAVPGFAGALSGDAAGLDTLIHLRLVLSASELALLPYEITKVPTGPDSAGEGWLALQTQVPVCITRRARNVPVEATRWPVRPRVLFLAGDPDDIPYEEHLEALLDATEPYRVPGRHDPQVSHDGRRTQYGDVLTVWKGVRFDELARECADSPYSHVHVLAHGVPDPDSEDLSYGLALPGPEEVVSGERMAAALSNLASGRVHRPAVVTLASCDSGNVGSVIVGGASFAHALHQSGIPFVLASQFPLSKDGSVCVVRTLYTGLLRGENPWILLHRVRTELAGRFANHAHDWSSLVVYEALPEDLSAELEETRYRQGKRALDAALERLDRAVAAEGASLSAERRTTLTDAVVGAAESLPLEGAFRLECLGLRGSAFKRIAEAEHTIARRSSADGPARAQAYRRGFDALERSLADYRGAVHGFLVPEGPPAHRIASLHWVLVQSLSVATLLGRPSPEGSWEAARLSAEAYLEHPQTEERAWARGSLAELFLLRLAEAGLTPEARSAAARAAGEQIAELVRLYPWRDASPITSTRRQLARYVEWWGGAEFEAALSAGGAAGRTPWAGAGSLVETAEGLIAQLDRKPVPEQPDEPPRPAPRPKQGRKAGRPGAAGPATGAEPEGAREAGRSGRAPASAGAAAQPHFSIEMLPAGHGDCLWIEYGAGSAVSRMLIDCGTEGTYKALRERVLEVPEAERHFDLFMLSHVDADHIGGAIPFFQDTGLGVTFADVWFNAWKHISGFMGAKQGEMFSTLIEDRGLPWNRWRDGQAIVVDGSQLPTCTLPGGMQLTLLSPTPDRLKKLQSRWAKEIAALQLRPGEAEDFRRFLAKTQTKSEDVDELAEASFTSDSSPANGSSIAVLAEFGGKSALLAADAHAPVLIQSIKKLLRERDVAKLRLDAFKLPHHASQNNVSVELLKLLDCPRFLVSSNGSHFNHPDRQAVARCIKYGGLRPQLHFNFLSPINKVWGKAGLARKYGYAAVYPPDGEGLRVTL